MLLGKYTKLIFLFLNFTLHEQCEQGKVIGVGVCIYIYVTGSGKRGHMAQKIKT